MEIVLLDKEKLWIGYVKKVGDLERLNVLKKLICYSYLLGIW